MQASRPNPLPESVLKSAVADAQRVVALDEAQRAALFEALAAFVPSASGIDIGEMEELAVSTRVENATITAASRLAFLLRGSGRPGALSAQSVREALRHEFVEVGITGADALLEALGAIGKTMGARLSRAQRLERVLPTLLGTTISCDLRYLRAEAGEEGELFPMAIVRLELDEVDDAIFQCSVLKLKSVIKSLQGAVDDLERLERVAQNMPRL